MLYNTSTYCPVKLACTVLCIYCPGYLLFVFLTFVIYRNDNKFQLNVMNGAPPGYLEIPACKPMSKNDIFNKHCKESVVVY